MISDDSRRIRVPMMHTRQIIVDSILLFAATVLAVVTAYVLIVSDAPQWLLTTALSGLATVAMGSVVARFVTRPDHLKARQSHVILEIANESLSYLRQGLAEETAGAVCRIILAETEVAAVAITDTEHVLGFAGIGESHHSVGGPIITRATLQSLLDGEHRILHSKEEIGCPKPECLLRAAIVVPLEQAGTPVGTLKFYYTTPRLLNETQVTLAEGLAKLLSTQLELAELERQTQLATRMELRALQAQINPHFLFNTINTIAMLIRTDPERARELLRQFAAFYRRTLEAGDQLITLELELEYVRQYLVFECARFGDRIAVSEDIAPELLELPVPAFVLQPLVENAVKHGMRAEGVLHIELTASRDDGTVFVSVADDGVGIPVHDLPHILEVGFGKGLGIALKNVDDRLKGYFGGESGLLVQSWADEGTIVTMQIAVPEATEDLEDRQA